jgi:hypothetical protein
MNELESTVREVGYKLAVREMYGDNGASYHNLRKYHYALLSKLYRVKKVTE